MLSSDAYALPQDPFPVGYRAVNEELLASWKPRLVAFVSLPGLVVGGVAVGLLALFAADPGPNYWVDPTGLGVAFIAAFVLAIALWAWRLGVGLLAIVPVSYFLALLAALVAAPGGVNPSVGGSSLPVLIAEVALFTILGIVVPLLLAALTWARLFYAVTDQRAIEVTGSVTRSVRRVALTAVERVVPVQSAIGRRLDYGTVLLFDRTPPGGHGLRTHPASVRARGWGVAFVGIRRSSEAAVALERRLREVRARIAPPGPPASPAPSPTTPTTAMPPTERPSTVRTCPRCGTALVWVAPEGRYYCPRCSEYR